MNIEIDDPLDRLTRDERRALDAAFDRRHAANGRDEYLPKPGLSNRALQRGYRVVEKLRQMGSLRLPEPPTPDEWRVWHHKQAGWKYEALAAPDSPMRDDLRGSTSESCKQLAMRAVRRVEAFHGRAPRWWFEICARLMAPDAPLTD